MTLDLNRQRLLLALGLGLALAYPILAGGAEPKWIRVSSDHFSVLTDASQKKGTEVVVRLEQMRAIFAQLLLKNKLTMGVPIEVIALNSDREYVQTAPTRQGQPISAPGFFLPGEPNYIVLNLFADDSWRAVARDFALTFLYYNYPPTPGWFDEGFADYFSSLRIEKKTAGIGGDPSLALSWREDLVGNVREARNLPKSFTELLSGPVWLPLPDLFTVRHSPGSAAESAPHTLYYAESWIVMHYLLNKNKLPETGNYLGLVQNQQVPVEQAIQQAYGTSSKQLEQAVKDYFHSLAPLFQALDAAKQPEVINPGGETLSFPLPVGSEDVGSSFQEVRGAEAQAAVAEMEARLPEHREQALNTLQTIVANPVTDNAVAHRALAWIFMGRKQFDQVTDELDKARQLDARDPWIRFYAALSKYQQAQTGSGSVRGLSNMIQDLRGVIDWDPEFAEAYHLLALARLEGGGVNSALASIRQAIPLSPRSQTYLLDLARIYMEGKKWDEATALLEQLKHNPDPQVAQAARKNLEALPLWRKYGVSPEQQAAAQAAEEKETKAGAPNATPQDERGSEQGGSTPAEPQPDARKVQFLKGRLLSVDCSGTPAAVLTVTANSRTVKLHTQNYKSLLVMGADEFSCSWKNVAVSVNYKATGKADGDLMSVEIQ
jgi:tetratricopeptide (TPR) repeat protein